MKRDDFVYLNHILDSINQIEEYTKGLSKEEFLVKRWFRMGQSGKSKLLVKLLKISQNLLKKGTLTSPGKKLLG